MGDEPGVDLGVEGTGLRRFLFAGDFSVRDNRLVPYAKGARVPSSFT